MIGPVTYTKGGAAYYRPDIELTAHLTVVPSGNDGKRLKMRDDDGRLHIQGLVSTPDLDLDGEIVEPEAFRSSMPAFAQNPVMLAYHRMDWPVGLWDQKQEISEAGLFLSGWIGGSEVGIQEKVLDGVLKRASVGYFPKRVVWEEDEELWRITDLALFETSLVPIPANPGTFVEVAKAALEDIRTNDARRWKALTRTEVPAADGVPVPEPEPVRPGAMVRPDLGVAAKLLASSVEWTERNQRMRRDALVIAADIAADNGG